MPKSPKTASCWLVAVGAGGIRTPRQPPTEAKLIYQ